MLRKLLVGLLGAITATAAVAAPLTYAFRAVPIRAGIVVIDSQQVGGYQANHNPYVMLNLDSNKAQKPGGWTFYNPFASSILTPQQGARWSQLNVATGGAAVAGNTRISKRDAAYWEVFLSQASEEQLSQYDFLHLSAYGYISLNSNEREKLRRFMEKGGILWVDFGTSSPFGSSLNFEVVNGLPLGFGLTNVNAGLTPDADVFHPLLNFPSRITTSDLLAMESEAAISMRDVDFVSLALPDLQQIQSTTVDDYRFFTPVVQDQRGPTISVAAVGDGAMVVTTHGIAKRINAFVDSSGTFNSNVRNISAGFSSDQYADSAAKLVYNMIALTTGYGQAGKGARKSGSAIIDVGAPAISRFSTETPLPATNFRYTPPAILKGMVFVATDTQVLAYDADPSSDLDQDGNPDDGVADFSLGSNRDLIWASQAMPGPLSGVTSVEVPSGGILNQVSVVDGSGRFVVFNAYQTTPSLNIAPASAVNAPTVPEIDSSLAGPGPYQATYHDGLYFISDQFNAGVSSIGRVWVIRASDFQNPAGGNVWAIGALSSPVFGRPSASPTVGYIPIPDGSGGLDRVVYVPTRANVSSGINSTAGVHSLWLGVKGEKPFSWVSQGGFLRVVTRAHLNGLRIVTNGAGNSLGVKLTILDAAGNPVTGAYMQNTFDGSVTDTGGFLNIRYKTGQSIPTTYGVRLDYTIDWGVATPGYGTQVLRSQIFLPDDTARRRRILGNLALSPEGVLHVVHSDTSNNTTGGSYYAFKEERRGEFKMVSRFELFPRHQVNMNGATAQTVQEAIQDTDPIQTLAPGNILGGSFSGLSFRSGPTVHNGTVYVSARGVKSGFIPCSILMAFESDPQVREIVIGDAPGNVQFIQPDLARSDTKSNPNAYSTLSQNQFVYEPEVSGQSGTIRLENLMGTTRGYVGNSISLSQPIILRRSGQPDQLIEPNATASKWSPMLWYHVSYGGETTSPIFASGQTIFMAQQNVLPYFIRNGFGAPPPNAFEALVWGINSSISPNDPFLISDPLRPWHKQMYSLKVNPTFEGNPNIRWPQTIGVQSFEDWGIRLLQTSMGQNTDIALGVVGGDNVIAGFSDRGVTVFAKSDYIVCDEGRVARFDASGNPVWTTDSSKQSGGTNDNTVVQLSRPLVRPTRAYAISSRELLVVDTGANRIMRLDQSGRETRSIDKMMLDPLMQPDGYEQGEPLTLKEPRDVIFYTTRHTNPTGVTNPRPSELWYHYLIADSGNRRLIEVIDRYELNVATGRQIGAVLDANGVSQLGVLYWHSGSNLGDKKYVYSSLSRVFIEDSANPGTGRWVYAAGIGNQMPSRIDIGMDLPTGSTGIARQADDGNGGIVIIDGANTQVINEIVVPEVPTNAFWSLQTASFNSALQPSRRKRLGSLKSVTMRNVIDASAGPRTAIMITDADGVYEVIQTAANGPWTVRWMLPREAYKFMRRSTANIPTGFNAKDFTPTYAKRLDNGEVLVVNGYYGNTLGGQAFSGEIVQLNGDVVPNGTPVSVDGFNLLRQNLGFKLTSIKAELPPIQGARSLVLPVFVDRR